MKSNHVVCVRFLVVRIGALCVLLIGLAACEWGAGTASRTGLPGNSATGGNSGLPSLPIPAELQLRSTSSNLLQVDGGSNDPSGPTQRFSAAGANGIFSPDYWPPSGNEPAYATYMFNAPGYSGPHSLRLLSNQLSVEAQQEWLGLANFDANRWDWYQAATDTPDPRFDVLDCGPYVKANGDLMAVLVVLGTDNYRLARLSWLEYDEVEDNESVGSASPVQAKICRGLRGSLGTTQSSPGYDGDNDDYWTVDSSGDRLLQVTLRFDAAAADITPSFCDSAGNALFGSWQEVDGQQIGNLSGNPLPSPLYIHLVCASGQGDYSLGAALTTRPTAEFSEQRIDGVVPLSVHFDGSASTAPGSSIAQYHWQPDPDSDQVIVTSEPSLDWLFGEPGIYDSTLIVVNAEGFASAPASCRVTAHPVFTEIENNDSFAEGSKQQLDVSVPGSILGNLGHADDESFLYLNDGDWQDYYRVSLRVGHSYRFQTQTILGFWAGMPYPCFCLVDEAGNYIDQGDPLSLQQMDYSPQQDEELAVLVEETWGVDYNLLWHEGPVTAVSLTPSVDHGSAPLQVSYTADVVSSEAVKDYTWAFVWYDTAHFPPIAYAPAPFSTGADNTMEWQFSGEEPVADLPLRVDITLQNGLIQSAYTTVHLDQ